MKLLKKELLLDQCETLYHCGEMTQEILESDFIVKGGTWSVQDGWLVGENRENFAAMVISRDNYFGNVMLDFRAATVLPCTHDINAMWNGSWNEDKNIRDVAYVAGLQGWWHGKVGFEKSPDYQLNAATPLFPFNPGEEYHIQMGSIDGHVFVIVNGKLVLEVTDPDPIDASKYGKIGFEAYCAKVKIRDISVKRVAYHTLEENYIPEF